MLRKCSSSPTSFADVEDVVNAILDKYKRHTNERTDKDGPSSLKRKERKCKGDFSGNTEKGGGGRKMMSNNNWFEKIMNSPY
jgi:hypothetical protein